MESLKSGWKPGATALIFVLISALIFALAACSPTLNWRDVRPADSGASALFPCKPDRFTRSFVLGGEKLQMVLNSCAAGDVTYALSHAKLAVATRVNPVLEAMQSAAAGNLGGTATLVSALVVPGMAPHPITQRWAVQGKRADGTALYQQFGVFTRGLHVYQATVVGHSLDPVAADTFFGSLQLTQ
ncbi:MAG: hypothetical protein H7143_13865 [Pseudorhodobacter sp.]|nr:hypothetical protein [Rhizobacter sp.]